MYRNSEGYYDPTAGQALSGMNRKERSDRRKAQRKQNRQMRIRSAQDYKNRPKVYVSSPYAGDTERNRTAAIRYCRYVIDQGMIPVASHLLYPQVLDDSVREERELGLVFGLSLLALCDEVWVFGSRVSTGMEKEIVEARRLEIPLRYVEEVEVG